MNKDSTNYEEDLIDLKLTEKRKEVELAYSILSFENSEDYYYRRNSDRLFTDSLLSIKADPEFIRFLDKANSKNIETFKEKQSNQKINHFIEGLSKLDDLKEAELSKEREKTLRDIKKLEGTIFELDNLVLSYLPEKGRYC